MSVWLLISNIIFYNYFINRVIILIFVIIFKNIGWICNLFVLDEVFGSTWNVEGGLLLVELLKVYKYIKF